MNELMIRLEDVHKNLGGRKILDGVNLTIEKGETLVIIGGSGTGKSVTLKHMIGLMEPDHGNIFIDNIRVNGSSARTMRKVRNKMGVLFQSGALLNWMTVGQNVGLPLKEKTRKTAKEIEKIVDEKLELVDMKEAKDKLPSEISGGMKKRAGLARALATGPDIILYDEPTSGLDPVMSNVINRLVLRLQEELSVTTVVVTHDMSSAYQIANRIAMLFKGKIIACEDPASIQRSTNPIVKQFIQGNIYGPIREE
jgi:phospholipid/cholesterol/gamma-HCH transport system ATP-binding protein